MLNNALDPIIRVVTTQMIRLGGDSVLENVQPGAEYDAETSTIPVITTSYPIRTLIFDYIQKRDGLGAEFGSLIRNGDKQTYIQPKVGTPSPRAGIDTIVAAGIRYSIVTVKAINPSGTQVVMYEVFLRE